MSTVNSVFKDVALISDMIFEWQDNRDIFEDSERYGEIRRIGIMGTLDPDYRALINPYGRLAFAGLFSNTTLFPDDRDSIGEPEEDVAGFFQFILEHALAAYVDEDAGTGSEPLKETVLGSLSKKDSFLLLSKEQLNILGQIGRAEVSGEYRSAAHIRGIPVKPGDKVQLKSPMLYGAEVIFAPDGSQVTLGWPEGTPGGYPRNYVLGISNSLIWPDDPKSNDRLAVFILPVEMEKDSAGALKMVFYDRYEIEHKLGSDNQG